MKSFWFRKRQVMLMDAHGGRPARNFYVKPFTIVVLLALLISVPFVVGAWYAPFHSIQELIPENLKLKRQNDELRRNIADLETMEKVKDEQVESLKEEILAQENNVLELTKELHMFKTILGERKAKGVQVLKNEASWVTSKTFDWQALFVKGGSFPRYLIGYYQIFALDVEGIRHSLSDKKIKYRFETHAFMKKSFEWKEEWKPTELELVIYDSRGKEVLKQTIQIQGK